MLQIFAAPELHSIKRTNIRTQQTPPVKHKPNDSRGHRAAPPSARRDRVLVPRLRVRSRSPQPSLIKGENTPLASRTPSWRAPCQRFLGRGFLTTFFCATERKSIRERRLDNICRLSDRGCEMNTSIFVPFGCLVIPSSF
jgi:hypothetical protein